MKTTNISRHQWNELIFENRNKSYGAYDLRETYDARVIRALLLAFSFITIAIAMPLIISHYFTKTTFKIPFEGTIVCRYGADIPFTTPKQTETKKIPNTNHPKQNAPLVVSNDSAESKKQNDHPENIPASNGPVADAGTTDKGVASDGNPTQGSTGTDLPIEAPPVRHSWQVDKMPEFPGGTKAFYAYMRDHIRYPNRGNDAEGIVYVSFVINPEGAVTDVKLLHGIGHEFDEEALNVISKMPSWKPGLYHNESVSTVLQLPVKFVLEK